jgi:predicted amidophosphoribosyltransferase
MAVAGAFCPLNAQFDPSFLAHRPLLPQPSGRLPRSAHAGRSPYCPQSTQGSLECMTITDVVARSLRATLELALPTTCGGCGAAGATWCTRCADESDRASYCGGPRQVRPRPSPVGYPPTWAATPYAASARAALVAFKDCDRRDLETVLAPMLSDAMAAALATDPHLRAVLRSANRPVFVVPVPSSASAVRRRGDAPLELMTRSALAGAIREGSGGQLLFAPALRIRRRVADQAGLNHRQRATNLEHAMQVQPRWRASVRGVTCLLTDDVLTTGATLVEAARALREAGSGHVAAATVAATQRRAAPTGGVVRDEGLRSPPRGRR